MRKSRERLRRDNDVALRRHIAPASIFVACHAVVCPCKAIFRFDPVRALVRVLVTGASHLCMFSRRVSMIVTVYLLAPPIL